MSVNLFTKEEAKQMKQDYDSGLSAEQVAEKYYCSAGTVYRYLKSVGYTPRHPNRKYNIPQLLSDWNAGHSAEHFRKVYGIDRQTMAYNVFRWRRMGYPFRRRRVTVMEE